MEGFRSVYSSTIRRLNRLEINGNEALNGATIISEVENGNTFIAMLNGLYFAFCVLFASIYARKKTSKKLMSNLQKNIIQVF